MSELRQWQAEAVEKFLRTTDDDFLCVATPGAGKTRMALETASRLMVRGEIGRILIVTPSSHLRVQWARAAHSVGVQLDPTYTPAAGALARDFDGAIVTYQAIAFAPVIYRKLCADRPTLVILDEVHHCSTHSQWGNAIEHAFSPARRRLSLSGTPFRTDGAAIPFIRHDSDGLCVPDYSYDYADALREQIDNVVRQIQFHAFDGHARWREAGAIESRQLIDTNNETRSKALRSALLPSNPWIMSVLREADKQLTRDREIMPDAGGLVVASGQREAMKYAALLQSICGEETAVAISDEPDSSERITSFTSTRSRWIVAVQMITEGVDIPRLTVGVYATVTATELFFRQVVGRFVRTRPNDEEIVASLFIPSVQPLLSYASKIERITLRALLEAAEQATVTHKDVRPDRQLEVNIIEPLTSSEAVHYATILASEQFSDAELQVAKKYHLEAGLPGNVTEAQVARLLRIVNGGRTLGNATINVPNIPLVDDKKAVRNLIKRRVAYLVRLTLRKFEHVYADLNRLDGVRFAEADLNGLNKRLEMVDRLILDAEKQS